MSALLNWLTKRPARGKCQAKHRRLLVEHLEDRVVPTTALDFALGFGSPSFDQSRSTAVDANGNSFVTGTYRGTAEFDPGPGAHELTYSGGSGDDIFVASYDSQGDLRWAHGFGSTSFDQGTDIAVDAAGSVYVTGHFGDTVDFDPGAGVSELTSASPFFADVFVLKLDNAGNFVWARGMGGNDNDLAGSIAVDSLSNVYVTGSFRSPVADFDPDPIDEVLLTNSSNQSMFVLKMDSAGDLQWAHAVGGTADPSFVAYSVLGLGIAVDADGNVFTTGQFGTGTTNGSADFDPDPIDSFILSSDSNEAYVQKRDANGDFLWAEKVASGSGTDRAEDIAVDAAGDVYITGRFNGSADFDAGGSGFVLNSTPFEFDPTLHSVDAFVTKRSGSTGAFDWAVALGGPENDNGIAIAVTSTGEVHTVGQYRGAADFDPGSGVTSFTSSGGIDIYHSALDANGNFVSARTMGSSDNSFSDAGWGVAVNDSGTVFVTGAFTTDGNFDPGQSNVTLTSVGQTDGFLAKFAVPVEIPPIVINEIDYDQPGADSAEFVELKNVGAESVNLAGLELRLLDSSGQSYGPSPIVLPDVELAPGDYYVIAGNAATVANTDLVVSGFQLNDGPAAVALYAGTELVDTVSYEGIVAGYTETAPVAPGDDGVEIRHGIARRLDGQDTGDNSGDFVVQCITPGMSNDIHVGDVIVDASTTQEFLDSLIQVCGDVVIDGTPDVISVNLPNLTFVDGDLTINNNASLFTFSAPNVHQITGQVQIIDNANLSTLDLNSLADAGSVEVINNADLESLVLSGLSETSEDVTVADNDNLSVIDLSGLIDSGGSVVVSDNDNLSVLDLTGLTETDGDVAVSNNANLSTLDLGNLDNTGGDVTVNDNANLSTLDLGNLNNTGGDVTVNNNDSLSTLDLPNLTDANGDVTVNDNSNLSTLDLGNLDNTGGDVTVNDNANLSTLDLGNLNNTGGDVSVIDNDNLSTLDLPTLVSSGGDVTVVDNDDLSTLDLGNLDNTGGDVTVNDNANLSTLDLGNLNNTGGDVTINNNDSLSTLDLPTLVSAGGDVSVSENANLSTLDLPALANTGGDVNVESNDSLSTINLPNLSNAGGDLIVGSNANLSTLDLPTLVSAGGDVNVGSNANLNTLDLPALANTGGDVNVESNDSLSTINLPNLSDAGGDLIVGSNANLSTLDLPTLVSAGGDVSVSENANLSTLDLPTLVSAGGEVNVGSNANLSTLDLPNLASTGADFTLASNGSLNSVNIGNLITAGGSFTINDNDNLSDIDLPSLASAGADFTVAGNDSLNTISAGDLTEVSGSIDVNDNGNLNSIDLGNLSSTGASFTVADNGSLNTIGVGNLSDVAGDMTIDNNNSELEVDVNATSVPFTVAGSAVFGDGSVAFNRPLTAGGEATVEDGGEVTINDVVVASKIIVRPGGEVKGEGTIDADVENEGTIEPGLSPEKLTIDADYLQPSAGVLVLEIGGTTPITQHDVLAVNGNATIAGTIVIDFINGFVPTPGQSFNLFDVTGTLDSSAATFVVQNGPPGLTVNPSAPGGTITVAPAVTIGGIPAQSFEGAAIQLTGTVTNPDATNPHSYAWSVTKNSNPYVSGSSTNFSFTPDDNGNYEVTLTFTDGSGTGSDTVTIVVDNLAPSAGISGPASGLTSNALTFTLSAGDPSSVDQSNDFTYHIDWNGDGTVDQMISGPNGMQVAHTFAAPGQYVIGVKAWDKDGAASGTVTHTVTIIQGVDIDLGLQQINLNGNGVVPIAILTTANFDATTLDVATLSLSGAGIVHHAFEDVDGDGDMDLVLHLRRKDLIDIYAAALAEDLANGTLDNNHQTVELILTGKTHDGADVLGSVFADLFMTGKKLEDLLATL